MKTNKYIAGIVAGMALAPMAFAQPDFAITPAGTACGSRTLRAFVDSQCKTAETQEANNRIAYPYAAVLPDLVVDRITINLSTPRAFQNFTVTVLVKNIGNGTWRSSGSPVWVHWHLIGPGINEYTRINMANYTNTLMPGAGYVWITTWKLPAGSYRFEATVDDSNAVPESNELNNTLSRTFVVTR